VSSIYECIEVLAVSADAGVDHAMLRLHRHPLPVACLEITLLAEIHRWFGSGLWRRPWDTVFAKQKHLHA
tara:strand:+ start:1021 stop:1230 length:210 start_codon:yes stop_codon:yes gene_type:complete